jgi:hypothetical protein
MFLQEVEENVKADMTRQMQWHMQTKPVASMLKFRLPYAAGKTEYLDGGFDGGGCHFCGPFFFPLLFEPELTNLSFPTIGSRKSVFASVGAHHDERVSTGGRGRQNQNLDQRGVSRREGRERVNRWSALCTLLSVAHRDAFRTGPSLHFLTLRYEAQMFHFNCVTRVARYRHDVTGVPGLDYCYDCRAEVHILEDYLANLQGLERGTEAMNQAIATMSLR